MSPELVYSITNTAAVLSWVLLAILPGRRWVPTIVTGAVVPSLFAVLYVAIVVSIFGRSEGSFATLAGVAKLFSEPWLLLAGWVHYLAFDLLVGSWEVTDARRRGIPHLLVVPCLLLTFLFGPAGWLLYRVLRLVRGKAAVQTV